MSDRVTLATPRLILREFTRDDAAAVQQYAADPDVVRYLPWGPNSVDDTRKFLRMVSEDRRRQPRLHYHLAATVKTDGALIGGGRISIHTPEHREASIGYVLGRQAWGQGYATELAQALLAFGFERLGMHRIFAVCDPRNVASARVLEKVGMRREGHLRDHRWEKGRWVDELLYAVLEPEWRAAAPKSARAG